MPTPKRTVKKKPLLDYEDKLMELIRQTEGIPLPVRQYKFSKGRRWRVDFAWPAERIIVEVEGGVFSGGWHVTGSGFTKDCIKYNAASLLGFTVYRFTTTQIRRGLAIETLKLVFCTAGSTMCAHPGLTQWACSSVPWRCARTPGLRYRLRLVQTPAMTSQRCCMSLAKKLPRTCLSLAYALR